MRRWMLRSLFLWQHNVLAIGRKSYGCLEISEGSMLFVISQFLIYIICCGKCHTFLTPSTCHPKVGLKSVDDDYKVSATHVYALFMDETYVEYILVNICMLLSTLFGCYHNRYAIGRNKFDHYIKIIVNLEFYVLPFNKII